MKLTQTKKSATTLKNHGQKSYGETNSMGNTLCIF